MGPAVVGSEEPVVISVGGSVGPVVISVGPAVISVGGSVRPLVISVEPVVISVGGSVGPVVISVGGSVGPIVISVGGSVGPVVDETASHSSSIVAAPDATYSKQYSFSGSSSLQFHCQHSAMRTEKYLTWCKRSHQNNIQPEPLRCPVSTCRLRSVQRRNRLQFSSDSNYPKV